MRGCGVALAENGISAEVIDLRSLKPLDEAAVLASVRKTGRAVLVHEAAGHAVSEPSWPP